MAEPIGALRVELSAGWASLEQTFNKASRKSKALEKTLGGLGRKLTKLGTNVKASGQSMLPLSAAMAAVGVGAAVTASKFEASMTRMNSIANVSADEIQMVRDRILELATVSGVGPQKLAEAMMFISSTTSDTSTALEILEVAAKAASAGLGEAADVGKAITSIVNSYGSANITAARAADILAATVKAGGAAASELAPTLANVIPIAAQLGINFEEVGANIATVTKLGVPAEQAVTQLA